VRVLAWATIALTLAGFAVAMTITWHDWEDEGGELLGKSLAVCATLALAASQTCATTSRRRPGDPRGVRALYLGAIALAATVSAMVVAAVTAEIDDETFYRALGALVVADLLFVILQSVVRRLAGTRPEAAAATSAILVSGPADAIDAAARELEARGLRVERDG